MISFLTMAVGAARAPQASFQPNWGDIPTWLAVVGAVAAGIAAFRQLSVMQEDSRRRTLQLERAQADQVDVTLSRSSAALPGGTPPAAPGEMNWSVRVHNGSRRPIRNVSCILVPARYVSSVRPVESGEIAPMGLSPGVQGDAYIRATTLTAMILRAGSTWSFLFPVSADEYPDATFEVGFNDDAGLEWNIQSDLHLHRVYHYTRRKWLPGGKLTG